MRHAMPERPQYVFRADTTLCGRRGNLEKCYSKVFKKGHIIQNYTIKRYGGTAYDVPDMLTFQEVVKGKPPAPTFVTTYTTGIGGRGSRLIGYRKPIQYDRKKSIDCAKKTGFNLADLNPTKGIGTNTMGMNRKAFERCMSEIRGAEEEPIGRQLRTGGEMGWKELLTPKNVLIGLLGIGVLYLGYQAIKK